MKQESKPQGLLMWKNKLHPLLPSGYSLHARRKVKVRKKKELNEIQIHVCIFYCHLRKMA